MFSDSTPIAAKRWAYKERQDNRWGSLLSAMPASESNNPAIDARCRPRGAALELFDCHKLLIL